MAGIHQFTSSLFIQSGSQAQFQSGIVVSESFSVAGVIRATSFTGDGSGLTGVGAVFFAGSGSGVSGSPPQSIDHVLQVGSGFSSAPADSIIIHTTSSGNFKPDYYNFVKITDRFETLQSGSMGHYVATNRTDNVDNINPDENDLAPGVHRYLVYGAKTGSGGETHQVFTTVLIKGFVNVPPTIVLPTGSALNSPVTLSMEHDSTTLESILHFTNSFDSNTDDFIREYSASRFTTDPSVSAETASYNFTMKHSTIDDSDNLIATSSRGDLVGGAGAIASISSSDMYFTASISDYKIFDNNTIYEDSLPVDEKFNIIMLDNNIVDSKSLSPFTMSIVPPPTASISNIRLEFESGSGTHVPTSSYETTILYDDVETRLTSETASLDNRYTSSLVRFRVCADIVEPTGFTADDAHTTLITVVSGSEILNDHEDIFVTTLISGSKTTSSLFVVGEDATVATSSFNSSSEANGFISYKFKPTPVDTFFVFNSLDYNEKKYFKHADNYHQKVTVDNSNNFARLKVNSVPDIQISDVKVEVESGSFLTNVGETQRTASILYGKTTTLLENQTSSLEGYTKSNEYISESVVRLRLKAKITEPFGPHHTNMKAKISDGAGNNKIFQFHTGSGEANCIESSSAYDSQGRLVGVYTSSWHAFNFSSGVYTFSPIFSSTTNAGRTIIGTQISASVSVSATPPTLIEDIVYETETFGNSSIGAFDTTRKVLFGVPHHTIENTSSFDTHISASLYQSQSLTRFRIRAKVTEPFGPHHTESRFEKVFFDGTETITNSITFSTGSTHVSSSSSIYDTSNRLVSIYTSSFIGQQLSSSVIAGNTWSYTSGSIIHSPIDNSNFTTSSALTSSITVFDTEKVVLENYRFESEEYGLSASDASSPGVTGQQHRKVLYGVPHKTLTDSSSFTTHPSSSLYASQSVTRGRLKVRVVEPIGFAHSITNISSKWGTPFIDFDAKTGSVDFEASQSSYKEDGKFVVDYTSSWAGKELELSSDNYGGTQDFIFQESSNPSLSNISGENGIATTSPTLTTMTVTDTAGTIFKNLKVEAETFGESGVGVQGGNALNSPATSRSILYGESTTRGTSSGLDAIYTSSAVTRFRILGSIIEPVGPLHHSSSLNYQVTNYSYHLSEGTLQFNGRNITFSTNSLDVESSSSFYTSDGRFNHNYTSSFITESLRPSFPSEIPSIKTVQFQVDNTKITHSIVGENDIDDASSNITHIAISASEELQIDDLEVQLEAFPYSSSIGTNNRTEEILYGFNRTLTAEEANTIGDIWSGSAAVRVRVMAKITEPIGLGHFKTRVALDDSKGHSKTFEFFTGSAETASSTTRTLNADNKFVQSFTSSFVDDFAFTSSGSSYNFAPSVSLGTNNTAVFITDDGLNTTSTQNSTLIINDTPATEIKNLRIEVESSNSGSGLGTNSRATTILHGNTTTEDDKTKNDNYPNSDSKNQLTSVRVLTDIKEPFGPHHTSSKFTISGYNDSHIVTLMTGSTEVSSSSSFDYTTHGSQSVAYTSSFIPIGMSVGSVIVSASLVSHSFENNRNITAGTPTTATITVNPPPTASVFVSPTNDPSDLDWSSSADISKYVTYNDEGNNIVANIVSGISASAPTITSESALVFPTHLNVRYTEEDGALQFSIGKNHINGDSIGEDTASLTVLETSMDDFTSVETFTISVSGSNILPGSGSTINEPFTFSVIPSKPQSMDNKYWNSSNSQTSHDTTYNGVTNFDQEGSINLPGITIDGDIFHRLYDATLPAGLENYKDGDSAGTDVTNVVMAKETPIGATNYTMSFVPFSSSFSGNYGTTNRAFDFGDSGSLVVKVNGNQVVNASLQNNFNPSRKSSTQILSSYDLNGFTNGTASFGGDYSNKGRLVLTHVGVFNQVSQSITNGGVDYPNGYQGWSAKIQIDSKLRDGYNTLEFSHSFDDGTSQNWKLFDWYYDDGITEPTISIVGNPTMSVSYTDTEPTFSLSGVSFYQRNGEFLVSFKDRITGIAHNTIREQKNANDYIMKIADDSGDFTATTASSHTTPQNIELHSQSTRKGLFFTDNTDLIPSASSTASILNYVAKSTRTSNSNDAKGNIHSLIFTMFKRQNFGTADSWVENSDDAVTIPVGRFINTSSISDTSTSSTASFFYEKYRWSSASLSDESVIVQDRSGDYTNFTSPSVADYNSITDISASYDLQQTYDGFLKYPTKNYTQYDGVTHNVVNPNIRDYTSASGSGDRYYYRALFIGTDGFARQLETQVEFDSNNPIPLTDIFADGEQDIPEDIDSKPIRIDFRLPGPINPNGINSLSSPGTSWGVITGGSGTSGDNPAFENWNTFESVSTVDNTHIFNHSLQQSDGQYTGGIVLIRIRYKNNATGSEHNIKSIKMRSRT